MVVLKSFPFDLSISREDKGRNKHEKTYCWWLVNTDIRSLIDVGEFSEVTRKMLWAPRPCCFKRCVSQAISLGRGSGYRNLCLNALSGGKSCASCSWCESSRYWPAWVDGQDNKACPAWPVHRLPLLMLTWSATLVVFIVRRLSTQLKSSWSLLDFPLPPWTHSPPETPDPVHRKFLKALSLVWIRIG